MEILLFALAVLLFVFAAIAAWVPTTDPRFSPVLRSLGLAAFAGAFLQPLL